MNAEAQFTNGPWHVDKELSAPSNEWLIAYGDGDIVRGIPIARTATGSGKSVANAHLIAASPDLYEALKDAREHVFELHRARLAAYAGYESNPEVRAIADCLTNIDATLAKAEGKS